jgi:DNA-binding CsgD family transcriptional regulator
MVAGKHEKLTNRTIEVLQYASVGYTQPEIAKLLFISRETVKTILRMAYKKTGCRNVTQLALYALATGQLTQGIED